MSDNYYIDREGNTVFTSTSLRKKGSCCKSQCLHCPFGHTLRMIGVNLSLYSEENSAELKELINELETVSDFTSSLLAGAFGAVEKSPITSAYLIKLKGVTCGYCYVKANKVTALYLKEQFNDQGITDSYLQSQLSS